MGLDGWGGVEDDVEEEVCVGGWGNGGGGKEIKH
jgi:hypothetical protein